MTTETLSPEDDEVAVYMSNADSLRELVQHIVEDPDAWRIPGADKYQTIIALVAAYAPWVVERAFYARWVNRLRYADFCDAKLLQCLSDREGFAAEVFPNAPLGKQAAAVWGDSLGPIKAVHTVRTKTTSVRITWNREQGLPT